MVSQMSAMRFESEDSDRWRNNARINVLWEVLAMHCSYLEKSRQWLKQNKTNLTFPEEIYETGDKILLDTPRLRLTSARKKNFSMTVRRTQQHCHLQSFGWCSLPWHLEYEQVEVNQGSTSWPKWPLKCFQGMWSIQRSCSKIAWRYWGKWPLGVPRTFLEY